MNFYTMDQYLNETDTVEILEAQASYYRGVAETLDEQAQRMKRRKDELHKSND